MIDDVTESVINSTVIDFRIKTSASMSKVDEVVVSDLREMTTANRCSVENWLTNVDVNEVVVKDFLTSSERSKSTTKDFLRSKDFDEMIVLIDEMMKDLCKRFNKNTVKRNALS